MDQSDSIENIEDIMKPFWFKELTDELTAKCYEFLDDYYYMKLPTNNIVKKFEQFQREHKFGSGIIKFGYLICFYKLGRQHGRYPQPNKNLEKVLRVKNVRENSGVMVFSIFTSGYPSYTKMNPDGTTEIVKEFGEDHNGNPGKYSCKYDCFYCPDYPNMPRSYLPGEPSVDRAIQCNFEVFKMIVARAKQYLQQGHSIDKAEVIIQGGTWDTYSYEYRQEFIRDVYYTFNVLMDHIFGKPIRAPLTMEEEIKLNELGSCRVVGLTPETRPDQINYKSIQFLRAIGATRVQLGVQHLDDKILRYVNRRCYTKDTIRAIKMLKDAGFKISGHLMPDLPAPEEYEGKMPEVDKAMFEEFNTNPDLKIDYVKVYPTVVTPHTKIKEWYDEGKYKPYGELKKMDKEEKIAYRRLSKEEKMNMRLENPLYQNILQFYKSIHPSMRIERVFRDIPTNVICGGTTQTSMRSEMDMDLDIMGEISNCIRYREAGNARNKNKTNVGKLVLKMLEFEGSKGIEYFLSWETDDEKPLLYSFLRLRLSKNSGLTDTGKVIFPELINCALIREVHTYGKVTPCKENQKYYENNTIMFSQNEEDKPQHKGLGKKLIIKAEEIARANGYNKIAVIAGVGVREYYRKQGYIENSELGHYQIKHLSNESIQIITPNMISNNNEITELNKQKIGIYLRLFYVVLIVFSSIILKYFL
jgi:ELP3 family radical SAM enzyme/protein acetyltransferase